MIILIILAFVVLLCFAVAASNMSKGGGGHDEEPPDEDDGRPPKMEVTPVPDEPPKRDPQPPPRTPPRRKPESPKKSPPSPPPPKADVRPAPDEPPSHDPQPPPQLESGSPEAALPRDRGHPARYRHRETSSSATTRPATTFRNVRSHESSRPAIDYDIGSPLRGTRWKFFSILPFQYDSQLDVDAKRIATTAKRYAIRAKREIAKNFDNKDGTARARQTAAASAAPRGNPQQHREQSERRAAATTEPSPPLLWLLDDPDDNEINSLDERAYKYDALEGLAGIPNVRVTRSTDDGGGSDIGTSSTYIAERMDRESLLLDHLWSLYASKCRGKFDQHKQSCAYAKRFGERDELGYHVRLALVNLLDADDPERLLQLGCILLLRATNQFSDELSPVFESLVDDYVICARLRQIDAMCFALPDDNTDLDKIIESTINRSRRIPAAIPRIRDKSMTQQLANSSEQWVFRATRIKRLPGTIATRYREPLAGLGDSANLNRLCSYNGLCFDVVYPNEYVNDLALEPPKVDEMSRRYIRYAWTERNRDGTVGRVLFEDGILVTYADNFNGSTETSVLLYRVCARRIVPFEKQSVDDEKIREGTREHRQFYRYAFERGYSSDVRLELTCHSKERYRGGTASEVRVQCYDLGDCDKENRWYRVEIVIPPEARVIVVAKQFSTAPKQGRMYYTELGDSTKLPGPTYDSTWLRTSDPRPKPTDFVELITDARCVVTFDGWFRDQKFKRFGKLYSAKLLADM